MPKPNETSLLAESNLPVGQRDILTLMRDRGLAMRADKFAYLAFGRDIEDLEAEELAEIPDQLLQPWLEENEQARATEAEKQLGLGPVVARRCTRMTCATAGCATTRPFKVTSRIWTDIGPLCRTARVGSKP